MKKSNIVIAVLSGFLIASGAVNSFADPLSGLPGKRIPSAVRVEPSLPGWLSVQSNPDSPPVNETLAINGAKRFGNIVVIPPGGIFYDASPLAQGVPIGGEGVLLGHKMILLKTNMVIEEKKNIALRKGQVMVLGDHVIEYAFPAKSKGNLVPGVVWHTVDGVAIRPHAVDQSKAGETEPNHSGKTLIHLVYDRLAADSVHYVSASAPYFKNEAWEDESTGKTIILDFNSVLSSDHRFSVIPIACPIGHHIGLMVYNTVPIVLPVGQVSTLFGGYLSAKPVPDASDKGFSLVLNGMEVPHFGKTMTVFGKSRNTYGLAYLARLNQFFSSKEGNPL